jgi:phenylacetate-CoA ligase
MLDLISFLSLMWKYMGYVKYPPCQRLAIQARRLRSMLHYAARRSLFYQKQFAGFDLQRCPLQALPTLTKAEMMAHFDDVVTDRRLRVNALNDWMLDLDNVPKYYLDEYVVYHTSGISGQSAVVVQDHQATRHLFAMQAARGHAQPKTWGTILKKALGEKARWAVLLFQPDFIPSCATFAHIPPAVTRLVDILRLNFNDPFPDILRQLEAFRPTFITAYPHVLEHLAEAALDGKTTLAKLQTLELAIAMSEPLLDETRDVITQAFGVPVANHYAMGECPGLTLGCPLGRGAHLNTDLAVLENVDQDYQPVPPGSRGAKVLITNLLNHVQPFIRYEIDDMITLSEEPCPCGNPLPLIQTIAGRSNDQFWMMTENGSVFNLSHFLFKDALLPLLEVAEFQALQTGINRFQVFVQFLRGKSLPIQTVRRALERKFQRERLPVHLDLEITPVEKIAIDPRSGKLRRFINQIGKPLPHAAPVMAELVSSSL